MYRLKIIVFFAGFSFAALSIRAQDWNKVFEYEQDAEYYMADKQFEKAADAFIKALKVIPNSSNYKYKIGYCYLSTDDKKLQALEFLEAAAEDASPDYKASSLKETKAPLEAIYLLAKVYQFSYRFSEAATTYKRYKDLLKPNDKLIPFIDKSIDVCNNAKSFINDSVSVKALNLGEVINNEGSNINAIVSGDGKTLAYTTVAKTGNDIFVSNKVDDKWSAPKKITTQLGNKYLLTSSLSFNGQDLYLVSDDPINSEILVTTLEKNKWIKPLKFSKPINTKANENHACISNDGNTIYFTSDRKGGLGGFDIYKSTVNDKGTWGDPVNMGSSINTEFNEATPFLSPDGNYLFFSSEGHNNMGGYDIFYVNLSGNPKVVNLGYPINTPDNNLFYCPENNWESGFLSFNDKNSIGKKDIYHVDISRYINLTGKIITDNSSNVSTPYKIAIFDSDKNDTIKIINSTATNFTYRIGTGNYKVIVKNNKFLPFSDNIAIPSNYTNKDYSFEAHMLPLVIEKPKVISEVVIPKEVKSDSIPVKKPEIVVPKEVKKPEIVKPKEVVQEKPREVKKEEKPKVEKPKVEKPKVEKPKEVVPEIKVIKDSNSSSPKIVTYSVQLMALNKNIGVDYFKGIENLEITITSDSIYRYSVGTTESIDEAMVTLKKVKDSGYSKAFIRINREDAIITIQLMALKKPVEASYFSNLDGVNISKGNDGFYRYYYGNYSSLEDAKNSLQQVIESGYKSAFIKKIATTTEL